MGGTYNFLPPPPPPPSISAILYQISHTLSTICQNSTPPTDGHTAISILPPTRPALPTTHTVSTLQEEVDVSVEDGLVLGVVATEVLQELVSQVHDLTHVVVVSLN